MWVVFPIPSLVCSTPKILNPRTEIAPTHIPKIPPKNPQSSLRFVRNDPQNLKRLSNPNQLPEPLIIPLGGWGGGSYAPALASGRGGEIRTPGPTGGSMLQRVGEGSVETTEEGVWPRGDAVLSSPSGPSGGLESAGGDRGMGRRASRPIYAAHGGGWRTGSSTGLGLLERIARTIGGIVAGLERIVHTYNYRL